MGTGMSGGVWQELGLAPIPERAGSKPFPFRRGKGDPPSAFPSCRNQAFGPRSIFLLGSGSGSWLGNLPCSQQEPLQRGGGVLLRRDRFVPGGFLSPRDVPQELQSSCVSVRAGGGKAWCFMEVPVCVGTWGDAVRNELSYRSPEPIYR